VFEKTYQFIEQKMTDWNVGDWHQQIAADGRVDSVKGHRWKAAYHNGRAMMECINLLR
jgi:mannobiose 2-epimerase